MVAKTRRSFLEVRTHGPATVIHLHLKRWHYDPLASTRSEAEQHVESAVAEILRIVDRSEPLVVLNFRAVTEFTGSALSPIVKLATSIQQRSGVLAVCYLPLNLRDIIAATRLDSILSVFPTETEAIAAILSPSIA